MPSRPSRTHFCPLSRRLRWGLTLLFATALTLELEFSRAPEWEGPLTLLTGLIVLGLLLEESQAYRGDTPPWAVLRARWFPTLLLLVVGVLAADRAWLFLHLGGDEVRRLLPRLHSADLLLFYGASALKLFVRSPRIETFLLHLERYPGRAIAVSFAAAILVGTVLLSLPQAQALPERISLIDSLFTATSAVCVTGLVVNVIAEHYTLFGQLVILTLIQLGGLGIMTFTALFSLLSGRRMRIQDQLALQGALDVEALGSVIQLLRRIFVATLFTEGIGSLMLFLRFRPEAGDSWIALYQAVFHAISAFSNAGFTLFPDNLARFAGDPTIIVVVTTLVILGGIGFPVLDNLWDGFQHWRRGQAHRFRLTLHSKLVLTTTAVLLGVGTLLTLGLEWENTLAPLPWGQKLQAAYFHAVTPRTAGFHTLDVARFAPATLFLTILLMFVGGSPGSTAGGIKTTSFGVILLTLRSLLKGRGEVEAFRRSIPQDLVNKAIGMAFAALTFVCAALFLLLLTETGSFTTLAFETVSAFGTVGLSMGITPQLSPLGKLIIAGTMFVGRIGPLTLALALAEQLTRGTYRYPSERVAIG